MDAEAIPSPGEAVPTPGEAIRTPGLLEQVGAVGRRSIMRTLRQRGLLIFPLLFPLILFAINGSGLGSARRIPGFPDVPYRSFVLAVTFIQGALFVAITAGTDLARDIESGFFDRLALTPLSGTGLLAGQLGGALVFACIQSFIYLSVGLISGVGIASGPGGVVVIFALSIIIAFGFAGLGALLALRFGSGEAVQGFFPLLFVAVFLSSSSLPRNLIGVGWFRAVATYNPVSYMIEGLRSLIISGWEGRALALGFGLSLALCALTLSAASTAMKTRLTRT